MSRKNRKTTTIVGIDCSTNHNKVGLALGHLCPRRQLVLKKAFTAKHFKTMEDISRQVQEWIKAEPALVALDAPLGWPETFKPAVASHRAGSAFLPKIRDVDDIFMRTTDRYLKDSDWAPNPMSVAADKIAKTARWALNLLAQLEIDLAWEPGRLEGVRAIEVYPAATLAAFGQTYDKYKRTAAGHRERRESLIQWLSQEQMQLAEDSRKAATESDDVLDALVAVLTGSDFIRGRVQPVEVGREELVRKEGWIWVSDGLTNGSR